jgi:hypothetical protein
MPAEVVVELGDERAMKDGMKRGDLYKAQIFRTLQIQIN